MCTEGILDYSTDGVASRSFELWLAPDGRYRAITTSLDGSEASEEVAYDKGWQTVLITDPFGNQSALKTQNSEHYAIRALAVSLGDEAPEKASVGFEVTITHDLVAADEQLLKVVIPPGVPVVPEEEGLGSGGNVLLGSGSRSTTFYSYADFGSCVYAYNYRNTSTNFFTASSQYRGNCRYMAVSTWENAGYNCTYWLGWSGTSSWYESYSTYGGTHGTNRCSRHAGWHPDWTQGVPYLSLMAYPLW